MPREAVWPIPITNRAGEAVFRAVEALHAERVARDAGEAEEKLRICGTAFERLCDFSLEKVGFEEDVDLHSVKDPHDAVRRLTEAPLVQRLLETRVEVFRAAEEVERARVVDREIVRLVHGNSETPAVCGQVLRDEPGVRTGPHGELDQVHLSWYDASELHGGDGHAGPRRMQVVAAHSRRAAAWPSKTQVESAGDETQAGITWHCNVAY
eukprot:3647728-Prymnesium_polylepis.2